MKIDIQHWIRVSTAGEILGISRQSVYYHINEGNLRKIDIDGLALVHVADIDALDKEIRDRGRAHRR